MAVANLKEALSLDPLSPNARADLALAFYFCRRYEASLRQCRQTLSAAPRFGRAHHLIGLTYLQAGEPRRALEEFEQALASLGRKTRTLALMAHAFAAMGQSAEANSLAVNLEADKSPSIPPIDRALLFSAVGDYDSAFEWLEHASNEDDGELIWLRVDPIYDGIRRDPRFPKLVDRLMPPCVEMSSVLPPRRLR
jgi:tetratricopeptide (TPR) repeat protein